MLLVVLSFAQEKAPDTLFVLDEKKERSNDNVAPTSISFKNAHSLELSRGAEQILLLPRFSFEMPEGFTVQFEAQNQIEKNGMTTVVGRLTGDPYSLVSFTHRDGRLAGSIVAGGQNYQVRTSEEGVTISEVVVNQTLFPISDVFDEALTKSGDQGLEITTTSPDNFVDVIVGYTTEAAANADIEERITTLMAATNQMLADSCVNFRYRLLSINATGVATGAKDGSTVLGELVDSSGPYAALHALRDAQGADLVHLFIDSTSAGLCGIANLGGSGNRFFDNRAFGLTLYNCPTFVLAHELGHNMSLRHDRYQQSLGMAEAGPGGEHYGFVDTANKFESVMAYQDQCYENGLYCQRLNKFSNPRISHKGVPFGFDQFVDNADALNRSFPFVSNYRPSQGTFAPQINENCATSDANKDLNCFIASATFGSPLHPKINILRRFRDKVLKPTRAGRQLVKYYYQHSPRWAQQIRQSPRLRQISLIGISLVIFFLEWFWILFAGFVGFIVWRLRFYRILFAFILFLTPLTGKSSVSFAPYDESLIATNPSVSLGSIPQTKFGLAAELISGSGDATSLSKSEVSGNPLDVYLGYSTTGFALNLRYRPEFEFKNEITNTPLAAVSSSEKSDLILLDMSFHVMQNLPLGIRITQQNIKSFVDSTATAESSILGAHLGSNMRFSSLLVGGGVTYFSENKTDLSNNDQSLTAGWLSSYIGFGLDFRGGSTGDSTFGGGGGGSSQGGLIELTYRRNPQVVQLSGGSQVARPETGEFGLNFQYLYPLLSTGSFLFSASYATVSAQAIENLVPDPISYDRTAIGLGYHQPSWALNSTLSLTSQDSGYQRQDLGIRVAFTFFFSGGSDVSSFSY